MELGRFQHLLAAYGADLRSWPETERHAAGRLLAVSAEAARAHAATARLDRLLRSPAPIVSEAAVRRVLDNTLALPEQQVGARAASRGAGCAWSWLSTVFLTGMAALGLVVGLFDLDPGVAAPSDLVDAMFDTGLVRGLGW